MRTSEMRSRAGKESRRAHLLMQPRCAELRIPRLRWVQMAARVVAFYASEQMNAALSPMKLFSL